MSRAHAVAPLVGARSSPLGPAHSNRAPALGPSRPCTSPYVERALLLWPRLDRSRLRKVANDPARIAELVARRTSQPYEVILAMVTRQNPTLNAPTEQSAGFESSHADAARVALRIVRSEKGNEIQVQDLIPA
jgi:hypothetical protein